MHAPRPMAFAVILTRIVAGFSLLAGLAACGYKSDLYMPPPPPPDEASVLPPTGSTPAEAADTAPVAQPVK